MSEQQKRILIILLLLAAGIFFLLALPNFQGSEDVQMLQIFEQDEAAPLGYVFRMISPSDTPKQAVLKFFFYKYYYYGFPHFALSALSVLPLQMLDHGNNYPAVMLLLRQVVSVLPMLGALLLLVYLQDRFRTYRSVVLFIFLASVPAVLANNFWWHPDSLVTFFSALVLFFLLRDNLRFGRNFLLAAAACGVATATKLVGAYFFAAVGLTLVLGLVLKKAPFKRLVGMGLVFLLVMGLSFVAANPFLLYPMPRASYLVTLQKQTTWLSQGYGVVYEKGLLASWQTVNRYYGEAIFLLVSLGTALWGALRGPQRLLHAMILAWFIPVSIMVFFFTHFKFQYWLPAALPLLSCLIIWLPEKWPAWKPFNRIHAIQIAGLLVILFQFGMFASSDVNTFIKQVQRAENNPSIQFHPQAARAIEPLQTVPELHIYYDYGVYVPKTPGWYTETNYGLLEYNFIQNSNFDALLLEQQRINDYLNPNVEGIDAELFARNQQFYRDANQAAIKNYRLVYRDNFGLVFVREDLYQAYFKE